VKEDEMGRACSTNGERRNAYRMLVGKPEGKRPLRRPRRGWWTILKYILDRQNGMVWIGSIWFRVGTSGGKFLSSYTIGSSSRRAQLRK
jgi:hypothetical protein